MRARIVPLLALAATLDLRGACLAEEPTGSLYGTVVDSRHSTLAAVELTLTGRVAPQVTLSDSQGQFRFLYLAPGSYYLEARLEGFSTATIPNVKISAGRNTVLEIVMEVAAVSESIVLTSESPILDTREIVPGATLSREELAKIPRARGPWSLLPALPGALADRVDVGGSAGGQPERYVGPGSAGAQSIWSVNGATVTDMTAPGASPALFDLDALEEVQITTGGADASVATAGVVLNLITKRGTNQWRGSGRFLDAGGSLQSAPVRPEAQREAESRELGAEVGGPVRPDRLWAWGALGAQTFSILPPGGGRDRTEIHTADLALHANPVETNSARLLYLASDKREKGRDAAAARPPETTVNERGPTEILEAEDAHVINPSLFVVGLASWVDSRFQLVPRGGLGANASLDPSFTWHHSSFQLYDTRRPQRQLKVSGAGYFDTGSVSHELKFGAGYREARSEALAHWPGFGVQLDYYTAQGQPKVLQLTRDAAPASTLTYRSAYLQDTLATGNLTANLGLRYDLQGGTNEPRTVGANPAFPDLLPAARYAGGDAGFRWRSLVPRVGLTYDLGGQGRTLFRASYSRFADQLDGGTAAWQNPLASGSYLFFDYVDRNGNGQADPGEVETAHPCTGCGRPFSGTYDPASRGLLQSNRVDPHLRPPRTDEALLVVEHTPLPDLVVGCNLTYRKLTNLLETTDLVFAGDPFSPANLGGTGRLATRDDYLPVTRTGVLPDGRPYSLTFYQLKPGLASRGGAFLSNGPRAQIYEGASLSFLKPLSHGWMLRGNVNLQSWRWQVDDGALADPTPFLPGRLDGDPVLQAADSPAQSAVFVNSRWSYHLAGMVQVAPDRPWEFNLAFNLTGRQGYPVPYFLRVRRNGFGGAADVLAGASDRTRNDDLHLLDARVEKELRYRDLVFTLGVDVFNLTNAARVQQRQPRLDLPGADEVLEVTAPRTFRLGLRVSLP